MRQAFDRSKEFFEDLAKYSEAVESPFLSSFVQSIWRERIMEHPGLDLTRRFLDVGQHLDKARCHGAGYPRHDGTPCCWYTRYKDGRKNLDSDRPVFYKTLERWFDLECEVCTENPLDKVTCRRK